MHHHGNEDGKRPSFDMPRPYLIAPNRQSGTVKAHSSNEVGGDGIMKPSILGCSKSCPLSGDKRTKTAHCRVEWFAFPVQARAQLLGQVRRLSEALKKADKPQMGRVTRKSFARALAKEGGLGKVGEAELTR